MVTIVLQVSAPAAAQQTGQPAALAAATSAATHLFGWGRNDNGQIKPSLPQPWYGTSFNAAQPIALPNGVEPESVEAASDAGGNNPTLLLASDGHLYAWGSNDYGQLGDGTTTTRAIPTQVDIPGTVISASADSYYELAATAEGTIYQWGLQYIDDTGLVQYATPQPLMLPGGVRAVAVDAGRPQALALGANHKIYSWNTTNDRRGSLAQQDTPAEVALPNGVGATAIQASSDSNLQAGAYEALAEDGNVYIWGTTTQIPGVTGTPTAAPLPSGAAAVAISGADDHFFALDSTGQLFGWGNNYNWDLGDGTDTTRDHWVRVHMPDGVGVTAVSTGDSHTLAIGADGLVYGWGSGNAGDLETNNLNGSPIPVAEPVPDSPPVAITAIGDTSFVVTSEDPYPPRIAAADPPQVSEPGTQYRYQFKAVGRPAPQYSLSADAPAWLTIDPNTGVLSGTVPTDAFHVSYSVTAANSEGQQKIGPFELVGGSAVPVTGTVVSPSGAPVADAHVDGCDGQLCTSAAAAADGTFTLPWYAGTDITVTAYPKTAGQARFTVPKQTVPATGLDVGNLQFSSLYPAAPIVNPEPNGGTQPTVNWNKAVNVAFDDCPGGAGFVSVLALDLKTSQYDGETFSIPENPAGSGHYEGTIGPLYPLHGNAEMRVSAACPYAAQAVVNNTPTNTAAANTTAVNARTVGAKRIANNRPRAAASATTATATGRDRPARTAPMSAAAQAAPAAAHVAPAAAADLAEQVIGAIYKYGPKALEVKDKVDFASAIADILSKNGCEADKAIIKTAVGVAVSPFVDTFIAWSTPSVQELVVVLLGLTPYLAIAAWPIVRLVWPLIVKAAVDKLIDVLVDAAFKNKCGGDIKPNMLIDPSGTVFDTNGHPVKGATVTLLRSDSATGQFTAMDTGDPGIEPAVNPETTGDDGSFHWDVRAGYYELQALAAGCDAPSDSTRNAATLGPLAVPPPRIGLHLTLDCPGSSPPAQPTVTAMDTHAGEPSGGAHILISGTGFTPDMTVTVGGAPAQDVQYLSPTYARIITPAGTSGTADVLVTTSGGTSDPAQAARFTYATPATVADLSPSHGPLAGTTDVVIQGSGFTGATDVLFAALSASSFTVVSDTEIDATTPQGAQAGPVDVQVVNALRVSAISDADQFTYDPGPTQPTSLVLSPATATAAAGHQQSFTAHGIAADGTDLGDITDTTAFTIAAADSAALTAVASCTTSACTATVPGTYTVTGTAAGANGPADGTATLTVTADSPASVRSVSGDAQSTQVSQPFPVPLTVKVTDQFGNPTPGTMVTYTVTSGSANFSEQATKQATTDANGTAAATLTAGPAAGEVSVTATVDGLPAAGFVEIVRAAGTPRADLSVTIAAPKSLAHNATGNVTVTAKNAGPQPASTVYTVVRVPPELAVISSPGARRVGDLLLFRCATLTSGAQLIYTTTVKNRTSKQQGVLAGAATISLTKDPDLGNNVAAATIRLN